MPVSIGDPTKQIDRGLPSDQPSIAEGIAAANTGWVTTCAEGVPIASTASSWNSTAVAEALSLVSDADAIIVVTFGVPGKLEHEGIDRTDTLLPLNQS